MQRKLKKLVGITEDELHQYIKDGQIQLRKARLIPMLKVGDEMALTSIFLSSLNYVNEYRKAIFSDIKLSKGGKALFFTEVGFPDLSKERIDGLVLIISAGKIKDAAFFEMKNKNNNLDSKQIEAYMSILKIIGVDKLVTVSNEFTPDPTKVPYTFKKVSAINNYHFSWTYLLTVAHLLLFKNEMNIEDDDQSNIMREVLAYLEHKDSGVTDFNKMKPGWKDVTEKIISKSALNAKDKIVEEAVESWVQEEQDMGLMLSRELGVMVKTGRESKGYSIDKDIKTFIEKKHLKSSLKVIGSVSEISVTAEFTARTVNMSVTIDAPLDKGQKGRLGWVLRQIEKCQTKFPEDYKRLESELYLETVIKYSRNNVRHKIAEFEKFYELDKSAEITQFNVILIRDFGRNFESVRKFVELLEGMIIEFYKTIVQNLSNWDRPAPKI